MKPEPSSRALQTRSGGSRRPAFWRLSVLFFLSVQLLALGAPTNPDADFDAANKLYEQGKYREAAEAYRQLTRATPASAVVWFNLGNACFKSGQIGHAIAAYRNAQRLAPRDPDIRANLQFARNQVQGPTLPLSRSGQWLGKLTVNEWTLVSTAVLWAWFILLIVTQSRPRLRGTLKGYVFGVALVLVFCGVCLGLELHNRRSVQVAVVIAPATAARQGPLEESPVSFNVQDGAELLVLDRKDQWLQVSNGKRIGWLPLNQALISDGIAHS